MAIDYASLAIKIDSSEVEKGRSSVDKFTRSGEKADTAYKGLKSGFSAVSKAATIFSGILSGTVALSLYKVINLSSDLQETQGKFDVVFRGLEEQAESWSDTLVNSYAMTRTESKKALSSIQDLLVPTGLARDKAAEMSNAFVKLSADLGSFNNLPTEKVIQDFQSAIAGSTETVTKYGINIRASAIENEALRQGLIKNKKELTDSIRAQVLLDIATRQSSDALGDMARTSTSYANRLKAFQAVVTDLGTSFGKYLLPVASEVLGEITGELKGAENGLDGLAKSLSIKILQGVSIAVEAVRFLHNGLSGLILLGDAIIVAYATVFDFFTKGLPVVLKPLDLIFDGLVKLGSLEVNPFDRLQAGAQNFAESSKNVLAKQLETIEANNLAYDKAQAKITSYIDIVKKVGTEEIKTSQAKDEQAESTDESTIATSISSKVLKDAKREQEEYTKKIQESSIFLGQEALAHELSTEGMRGYKTAMQLAFEDSEILDGGINALTQSQYDQIDSTDKLSDSVFKLGDAYKYANSQSAIAAKKTQGIQQQTNSETQGTSTTIINNLNTQLGKSDIVDISIQQARESSRL